MNIPTYVTTDRAPLLKALKWAQNALNLQNWTCRLFLDGDELPHWLHTDDDPAGFVKAFPNRFHADIYINRPVCQSNDEHPTAVLFHELAHVAHAEAKETAECPTLPWEQLAWRTAMLLWELQKKGNPA